MTVLYSIGDLVQIKSDGEVGEVLSIHITKDLVTYTISSKEIDVLKKKVIEGVKTLTQDEIKEFTE